MDYTTVIKEKTLQINGIFARLNGNVYNTSKALEESLKSTSEIDKLCDSVAEQMRSLRRSNQSLHQQLYKKNERIKQLESQITSLQTDKDSLKKLLDDWDSEISISDDSLLNVSGSSAASVSVSVSPFKVKKETDCKFQTPDSKNDPSEPRKKTAHKSSTTPGSDKDHAEPKEKISRKSKKKTLESKDPKEPKKETACSSKSSPGFDKDCDEPSIKEDPNTSLTDKDDIEKF